MKKTLLTISILTSAITLSGCSFSGDPVVKKSNTGICHEKGTLFYSNTKNFSPYNTIDDCLNSGGRLPKR